MTNRQKGLTLEHWRMVMEKYRKAEGLSDLMDVFKRMRDEMFNVPNCDEA